MPLPFFGRNNRSNTLNPGGPPFTNDPGHNTTGPLNNDQLLGHTPPAPDPGSQRPRVGMTPIGQSGRANFYGLPQWDELNQDLVGTRGLRLLDEMYRTDAHLRRLVLAAWSPIVAGTWTLEPYGGEDATQQDRDIADAIWWLLTEWMSPNFYEHLLALGPLLMRFGFAPFEQVNWQTTRYQGKLLLCPKKLDVRMPWSVWRWWQDDFGELTHIGQLLPNKPDIVIPVNDLVYYRLGAEGDNWMGMSLLRHAYKHWYLKDKFERLDAVGQERRAVGVPIVYHSPEVPGSTLDALEAALANMHMSEVAYLLVPGWKMGDAPPETNGNQFLIDVIQFDSSAGEGIMSSIDYHQTAIAASFLTDFLELGHHQVGARATAEVQEDPFLTAINGALLPPVLPPLNRLIDIIRQTNWQGAKGSPTLKLTLTDQASLSEIATYVQQLVSSDAMQVDDDLEDWLRNYAGLPAANADVREQRHEQQQAQQEASQAAMENAAKANQDGGDDQNPDDPPSGEPASPGKPSPPAPKPGPDKQLDNATPVAGGVIVHAADTGRVLAVKRAADDTDTPDVRGSWEFPGGKLNIEDPSDWAGAYREWREETGSHVQVPGARRAGDYVSPDGAYHAFVVQVPHETDIQLGGSDRNEVAQTGWKDTGGLDELLSPRAQRLLPGLRRIITPTTLDGEAFAPMSTGTTSGDGLQMTPEVLGGDRTTKICRCPAPTFEDGKCVVCGGQRPKHLDAAAEPTAKWFERLLSQHQLRQAFDGCRDHIQAAVGPAVENVARQMANQTREGVPVKAAEPPAELVDALTRHYADMYQLGYQTVQDELARQRVALRKTLDTPDTTTTGAVASRLARARQRGEHSARNIVARIQERLGRDQITMLKDAPALQKGAVDAATRQLRVEALANTAGAVNEGRNDAGTTAPDVVGAYYTSVMDERSCDPCVAADTGQMLTPEAAVALGPPNPDCKGADYCRCALIWVLSNDPSALAAA